MRSNVHPRAVALLLGLTASLACSDNTPTCLPGSEVPCLYSDGSVGVEMCADDGLRYGECSAAGDGGAGAGGGGDGPVP